MNLLKKQLRDIKDYITYWITNSDVDKVLVVDFMNLFGVMKRTLGITDKKKIYNIIELMLKNLIHSDGFNRIIICVQYNQLEKSEFIELLLHLEQFLGSRPKSILVLPAINRSSMDDFFVILCSEILEGLKEHAARAGYLADDKYSDYMTKIWYKIGVTQLYTELKPFVERFKMLSSTDQHNTLMGSMREWLVLDSYNLYSRPAYSRHDGPSMSYALPYASPWRGPISSSRRRGGQGTIKHKKSRKVYKKTYKKHKTLKIKL